MTIPQDSTPAQNGTETQAAPAQRTVSQLEKDNGFVWEYGKVSYKPDGAQGSKVLLADAPYLRVTDTEKFEKFLPGLMAASLDGTSIRVRSQGVTRPMLKKNRHVSDADMKNAILNSLKGVRAPRSATVIERTVEVPKYIAIDGSEHATQLEARQWSLAVMAEERAETEPQA